MTKTQILEGAGEARVNALEGLRNDDMAREAEQLVAGTGWLPEPLRASDGAATDVSDTSLAVDDPVATPDQAVETGAAEQGSDRIAAE